MTIRFADIDGWDREPKIRRRQPMKSCEVCRHYAPRTQRCHYRAEIGTAQCIVMRRISDPERTAADCGMFQTLEVTCGMCALFDEIESQYHDGHRGICRAGMVDVTHVDSWRFDDIPYGIVTAAAIALIVPAGAHAGFCGRFRRRDETP